MDYSKMQTLHVVVPLSAPEGEKPWDMETWCSKNCDGEHTSMVDVNATNDTFTCRFLFEKDSDIQGFKGKFGQYVKAA